MDFANELDALITKAKGAGVDIGEMISELTTAADGLQAEAKELDDQDPENLFRSEDSADR